METAVPLQAVVVISTLVCPFLFLTLNFLLQELYWWCPARKWSKSWVLQGQSEDGPLVELTQSPSDSEACNWTERDQNFSRAINLLSLHVNSMVLKIQLRKIYFSLILFKLSLTWCPRSITKVKWYGAQTTSQAPLGIPVVFLTWPNSCWSTKVNFRSTVKMLSVQGKWFSLIFRKVSSVLRRVSSSKWRQDGWI